MSFNTTAQQSVKDRSGSVVKNLGTISATVSERTRAVVWFGIVPSFTLVGIIGNVSGLLFMIYGGFKQPFHLFLFALMGVDLFYLIIMLLNNSLIILEEYDKPLTDYLRCHAAMNLRTCQSLTYSACAHLITAMSFERLVNIMFPLRIKSFSRKHTIGVILFILALNIVLLLPGFLVTQGKDIIDPKTNSIKCIPVVTAFWKNSGSFSKHYVVIMLVMARFVPGVATLVANILISVYLARQRSHRAVLFANKVARGEQYEQFKITLTLIVLSIALLLSLVPSAMTAILSAYFPKMYGSRGTHRYTYLFVQDFGYTLRVVSAANDFFIYVMLSKHSRQSFIKMMRTKCFLCCEDKKYDVGDLRTRDATPETLDSYDNSAFDNIQRFED